MLCSYGATECGAITSNGAPIVSKQVSVTLLPLTGAMHAGLAGPATADACGAAGDAGDDIVLGEVAVSSPNLSMGYFNQPDETRKVFFEDKGQRWYRTGDVARKLSGGRYAVLGRVGEAVAMHDGAVVFPSAVEALYEACPLVSQVNHLCRGGLPVVEFSRAVRVCVCGCVSVCLVWV